MGSTGEFLSLSDAEKELVADTVIKQASGRVEGAVGWTAVAANVVPAPLARLFDLVVDQGKVADGRMLYHRHLPLIEFVGGQANVAGTKALLAHMGFLAGQPRPPRLPLPPAQNAVAQELVSRFELRFQQTS